MAMAAHLTKFFELGHIPMNIDIARLDNGGGIEATLMKHSAKSMSLESKPNKA